MKIGRFLFCLLAGFAFMPTGCNTDGLIGGECADGYAFCDESCISVTDDEANCGGCDIPCRRQLACIDAVCGGPDGDIKVDDMTGGAGGDGPGGAGAGDGDSTGGRINVGAGGPGGRDGSGGGGGGGGTAGGGTGGSACVAPFDDPNTCGSCTNVCPSSAPNCSPNADGGFECTPNCTEEPFITECAGRCVDLDSDAEHCGRCGKVCASEICLDGACVGASSGHQIAICASFERSTVGQTTLLANSVFLGSANPVRIMAYVRDTTSASNTGTDYALTLAADQTGREYEMTKVTALNAVNNQLSRSDYDVFIVYDQQNAPADRLGELGTSWADPINKFSRTGGVVVVLSGGGGTGEMGELIQNIGLFDVDEMTNHDGKRYYVQAPGDAVGINVVSPFLAAKTSCVFETTDEASGELVFVVRGPDPPAAPAVVHRIVLP